MFSGLTFNVKHTCTRCTMLTLVTWYIAYMYNIFTVAIVYTCMYMYQIQVQHPAAKSMIEISRTQDEEVGDGTTSVIILGVCTLHVIVLFV